MHNATNIYFMFWKYLDINHKTHATRPYNSKFGLSDLHNRESCDPISIILSSFWRDNLNMIKTLYELM